MNSRNKLWTNCPNFKSNWIHFTIFPVMQFSKWIIAVAHITNSCHVALHRIWFMKQWESCHFNLIWCMTLVEQCATIYINKLNPASWMYISKLCHGYHYIPTTEKSMSVYILQTQVSLTCGNMFLKVYTVHKCCDHILKGNKHSHIERRKKSLYILQLQ